MADLVVSVAHALGLWTGVASSVLVYAAVSAFHIFAIAMLVGPIVLVDLSALGVIGPIGRRASRTLRGAAALGLACVIVSGILLLTAKPRDYAGNSILFVKLAIVAVGILNAAFAECCLRYVRLGANAERIIALISLTVWISALFAGRWIAFS